MIARKRYALPFLTKGESSQVTGIELKGWQSGLEANLKKDIQTKTSKRNTIQDTTASARVRVTD